MTADPSPSATLLERTRELLHSRPYKLTMRKIAADTKLDRNFLFRVAGSSTSDFGVTKVQKLYEYLSGRKLDV